MKFIDEKKIEELLIKGAHVDAGRLEEILSQSRALRRLTLEEAAVLLSVRSPESIAKIFGAAAYVKNAVYGSRVVLFAPIYISNICANECLYCAFKAGNSHINRKVLTADEINRETEWLLKRGHKRILMVAGESDSSRKNIDYYIESIEAIYAARAGEHKIKRVNVNCAPLNPEGFKKLKKSGIGTYQLFQETYHEKSYRHYHPRGPKSDGRLRLEAIDLAFKAGIDDVGCGVLYGLYDYRFDTLALLSHVEHLEKKFGIGPHTISVPRLEPASGVDLGKGFPYLVSDENFKMIVAILRLCVPYTGIILSTREIPLMRDELVHYGVSQISAGSQTSPGGYTSCERAVEDASEAQFYLSDTRSLDEVVGSLIKNDFMPSFCAACYRKERTGKAFMELAKPGTIKGKCQMNALITLKEYLDDFASVPVKKCGYQLIEQLRGSLDEQDKMKLETLFHDIEKGVRDQYV